jgi:hypothetical protein
MLHSLGSKPRIGVSDSTDFYERRVVVRCGSVDRVTVSELGDCELERAWIPSSIVFLKGARKLGFLALNQIHA